ncbi:MAG: hypothetical protein AAGF26_14505 [Cyanobacteria bacterium P01_G01_bin.49]
MKSLQFLKDSVSQTWIGFYLRFLSICLLYGALVHIGNIIGLGEIPWAKTPVYWQLMDVILLIFDLVISVSLWLKTFWSIIAFTIGILILQILPYTLFRQYFVISPEDARNLTGLIGTEIVLIIILITLIIAKK